MDSKEYLNIGFDPSKLRKTDLAAILTEYGVEFSKSALKKELLELFDEHIVPLQKDPTSPKNVPTIITEKHVELKLVEAPSLSPPKSIAARTRSRSPAGRRVRRYDSDEDDRKDDKLVVPKRKGRSRSPSKRISSRESVSPVRRSPRKVSGRKSEEQTSGVPDSPVKRKVSSRKRKPDTDESTESEIASKKQQTESTLSQNKFDSPDTPPPELDENLTFVPQAFSPIKSRKSPEPTERFISTTKVTVIESETIIPKEPTKEAGDEQQPEKQPESHLPSFDDYLSKEKEGGNNTQTEEQASGATVETEADDDDDDVSLLPSAVSPQIEVEEAASNEKEDENSEEESEFGTVDKKQQAKEALSSNESSPVAKEQTEAAVKQVAANISNQFASIRGSIIAFLATFKAFVFRSFVSFKDFVYSSLATSKRFVCSSLVNFRDFVCSSVANLKDFVSNNLDLIVGSLMLLSIVVFSIYSYFNGNFMIDHVEPIISGITGVYIYIMHISLELGMSWKRILVLYYISTKELLGQFSAKVSLLFSQLFSNRRKEYYTDEDSAVIADSIAHLVRSAVGQRLKKLRKTEISLGEVVGKVKESVKTSWEHSKVNELLERGIRLLSMFPDIQIHDELGNAVNSATVKLAEITKLYVNSTIAYTNNQKMIQYARIVNNKPIILGVVSLLLVLAVIYIAIVAIKEAQIRNKRLYGMQKPKLEHEEDEVVKAVDRITTDVVELLRTRKLLSVVTDEEANESKRSRVSPRVLVAQAKDMFLKFDDEFLDSRKNLIWEYVLENIASTPEVRDVQVVINGEILKAWEWCGTSVNIL